MNVSNVFFRDDFVEGSGVLEVSIQKESLLVHYAEEYPSPIHHFPEMDTPFNL